MEATETQLSVTWSPADGDFDGYVLTCWSDSQTVHSPETTELNAACEGLQPGTLHTIIVSTVKSGWEPVESSSTTASTSKLAFLLCLISAHCPRTGRAVLLFFGASLMLHKI